MASRTRHPATGYAGVFYVEVPRRAGIGTEKVYYIRYRKQGRLIEEKAGAQYRDNMTAARAARIRGLRMEGRELSNAEQRAAAKAEAEARYPLDSLWRLFEEVKADNRNLKNDRIRYQLHISPLIGARIIPEITTQDVIRLRAKLENEGKAPQTVRHVLSLLKRLLAFALQKGYADFLPGRLHIPMPAVDNKVTENISQEQAKKLLQALDEEADQTLASLVRLALFTGMRRGALLNLQWGDLDFERGFITLRGDVAKKKKTESIPMNAQARAVLEGLCRTGSPYVFPGRYADRPRANISAILRRVREKAGLPKNFRPLHGLRHSFASWLASSGQVSMYELQKLLTHSSMQMTQRYAHLHDDVLRKASGVAGTLFSQVREQENAPGEGAREKKRKR